MGLFSSNREQQVEYIPAPASQSYDGNLYNQMEEEHVRDIISTTLDNSTVLIAVENALKGRAEVFDEDKKRYVWKKIADPCMTEEGIQSVLQEVAARVGKNVILGNINSDELERIMLNVHKQLIILFAANAKRFKIDDGKRSSILWQVSDIIYFSLTRAVGDGERRRIYTRTSAQEVFHRSDQHINYPRKRFNIFSGGQQ